MDANTPRDTRDQDKREPGYDVEPDVTPRRIGGDDSLAESSPSDNRSHEKIIVNEQRGNKTTNTPSQTSVNTSEENGSDEDIIDQVQDSDE